MPSLLGKFSRRLAKGEIYVFLGRFYWVRRIYAKAKWLSQVFGPPPALAIRAGSGESCFDDLSVEACVEELEESGICLGLSLPQSLVREIHDFAATAPCSRPGYDESFLIDEVDGGRLADGRSVALADVRDVDACAALGSIANDPKLLAIARGYFGYWPQEVATRLFWSVEAEIGDAERLALHQAVRFHYDVEGYNCLSVYFYLTDTDEKSGSHVVIRETHRRKPLSLLLSSRVHADERILERYGESAQLVVKGPRGFGFIEDPACFHKALAPVSARRLIIQLRFDLLERRLERPYLDSKPQETATIA